MSTSPISAAQPNAAGQNSSSRIIFASFIGTAIEFYDFYVYATAAALVIIFRFPQPELSGTAHAARSPVGAARTRLQRRHAIRVGRLPDSRCTTPAMTDVWSSAPRVEPAPWLPARATQPTWLLPLARPLSRATADGYRLPL